MRESRSLTNNENIKAPQTRLDASLTWENSNLPVLEYDFCVITLWHQILPQFLSIQFNSSIILSIFINFYIRSTFLLNCFIEFLKISSNSLTVLSVFYIKLFHRFINSIIISLISSNSSIMPSNPHRIFYRLYQNFLKFCQILSYFYRISQNLNKFFISFYQILSQFYQFHEIFYYNFVKFFHNLIT